MAGARHLDLNRVGQLKQGFVADFIIMAENPLSDLSALNSINTVVQQGNLWLVSELREKLSELTDVVL